MSDTPLVSVIMPAYNVERFAAAAVNSVLKCGYENLELIIIEDASTDSTLKILHAFSDPRIHLTVHPQNLGLTATLNEGLFLAQGKYVYRMDSDDLTFPGALSQQVSFMESHPDVGVLGGCALVTDEQDNVTNAYIFPQRHEELSLCMIVRNCIIHPSVLIRADFLHRNGISYPTDADGMEDYALWLEAFALTRFACLPIPTVYYRKRQGSATSGAVTPERFQRRKAIIAGFLAQNRLSLHEDELTVFTQAVCNHRISHKEKLSAALRQLITCSSKLYPMYYIPFKHALLSLQWDTIRNSQLSILNSQLFPSLAAKMRAKKRHDLFMKDFLK